MHSTQPLFTSPVTSEFQSTHWRHNSDAKNLSASALEWDRNRFEIYRSTLGHNSISSCTRAKPWIFTVFISSVIRCNCFNKMWRTLMPHILKKNDLEYKLKRRVWSQITALERIILWQVPMCFLLLRPEPTKFTRNKWNWIYPPNSRC